jgi:hypothetical protein
MQKYYAHLRIGTFRVLGLGAALQRWSEEDVAAALAIPLTYSQLDFVSKVGEGYGIRSSVYAG